MTAIFGLARIQRGCSVSTEMLWSIMATRKAYPATLCGLFLRIGKGSFGQEPQAESTVFAIQVSSPSRLYRDWERTSRRAFWPAKTARSGSQIMGRSIASRTELSHRFAGVTVFQGIKSPRCSKITPATCGWEWTMSYIYSRTADSVAYPHQITSRLEW